MKGDNTNSNAGLCFIICVSVDDFTHHRFCRSERQKKNKKNWESMVHTQIIGDKNSRTTPPETPSGSPTLLPVAAKLV